MAEQEQLDFGKGRSSAGFLRFVRFSDTSQGRRHWDATGDEAELSFGFTNARIVPGELPEKQAGRARMARERCWLEKAQPSCKGSIKG